jgi:hypothetical protein
VITSRSEFKCLTFKFGLTEQFFNVCSITADLSALEAELQPQPSLNGFPRHYELYFEVVILFGLTELKAQVEWLENVRICIHIYSGLMLTDSWDQGVKRRYGPGNSELVRPADILSPVVQQSLSTEAFFFYDHHTVIARTFRVSHTCFMIKFSADLRGLGSARQRGALISK